MNKVEEIQVASDHPRKRSKISRACDCCRRKKVRCNAEYSANLMKVTKICTNCIKNNESCTFSRTPLKRGPSKGYIKDSEDDQASLIHSVASDTPLHPSPPSNSSSNSNLLTYSNNNSSTTIVANTPISSVNNPAQPSQSLPFPKMSKLVSSPFSNPSPNNPSSTGPNSSIPQIILPPIVGYPSKIHPQVQKLNDSSPSSPQPAYEVSKNTSPPLSGPFWKVPYEMPHANGENPNGFNRRRSSSIDSISSASTNGSRFPSLKPSISINSDVMSDSDDDFYSVRSHNRTNSMTNSRQTSTSPRNSVSSLSSLNGRMFKNLYIGGSGAPVQQYYQPGPQQLGSAPPQMPQQHQPQFSQGPIQFVPPPYKAPIASLESNLQVYYEHFHPTFPILPFNPKLLNVEDEKLGGLFNQSLHNLINFKHLNLNDHISVLQHIISLYPFNNSGIPLNDSTLIIFLSSFTLVNYAIILNGDMYCLGISTLQSILNQIKVLENFVDFVNETEKTKMNVSQLDYDNIQLYLPKLYYCIVILDNLYSISFGTQKVLPMNELIIFLTSNLKYLIPSEIRENNESMVYSSNIGIFNLSTIFTKIISCRNQFLIDHTKCLQQSNDTYNYVNEINQSQLSQSNTSQGRQGQIYEFHKYFIQLIHEKLDLCKYIYEINESQKNFNQGDIDDVYEIAMDNNVKFIRLIKKFTNTIMNFANFIGNSTSKETNLINPLLNISIGQLFKMIKLNKLIIDNLILFIKQTEGSQHEELLKRCVKINNDLSISFNLLNLNLINLQLGTISVNMIKNKIASYAINFTIPETGPTKENSVKSNLNSWNFEFAKTILPFIERENIDGWY